MLTNKFELNYVVEIPTSEEELHLIAYGTPDSTTVFREDAIELFPGLSFKRFFVIYRLGWEMDNFAMIGYKDEKEAVLVYETHGHVRFSELDTDSPLNLNDVKELAG